MKKLSVKLTGVAPLICHNNQMVDPLNYFAKEMKAISSKRNKTEADLERMSEIEFHAGLYLYENKPALPAKMLSAVFINGAKKDKNGPLAKAGVFFEEHVSIQYEGSKDPEVMYRDENFLFRCPVKISQSTIMRTRPIFHEWHVVVPFEFEETVINKSSIMLAWEKAGQIVGIGDWRPQYGRFLVEEVNGERQRRK